MENDRYRDSGQEKRPEHDILRLRMANNGGNPRKPAYSVATGMVLCSDGHVSYKGYAMDNHLEHVVIRGDLGQHVKRRVLHIQNVNFIHSRLKKWINSTFWGVATKYMQDYLNWFKVKEIVLKFCSDQADELLGLSMRYYNVNFATV